MRLYAKVHNNPTIDPQIQVSGAQGWGWVYTATITKMKEEEFGANLKIPTYIRLAPNQQANHTTADGRTVGIYCFEAGDMSKWYKRADGQYYITDGSTDYPIYQVTAVGSDPAIPEESASPKCTIPDLYIPASVTRIGSFAFEDCYIDTIHFESGTDFSKLHFYGGAFSGTRTGRADGRLIRIPYSGGISLFAQANFHQTNEQGIFCGSYGDCNPLFCWSDDGAEFLPSTIQEYTAVTGYESEKDGKISNAYGDDNLHLDGINDYGLTNLNCGSGLTIEVQGSIGERGLAHSTLSNLILYGNGEDGQGVSQYATKMCESLEHIWIEVDAQDENGKQYITTDCPFTIGDYAFEDCPRISELHLHYNSDNSLAEGTLLKFGHYVFNCNEFKTKTTPRAMDQSTAVAWCCSCELQPNTLAVEMRKSGSLWVIRGLSGAPGFVTLTVPSGASLQPYALTNIYVNNLSISGTNSIPEYFAYRSQVLNLELSSTNNDVFPISIGKQAFAESLNLYNITVNSEISSLGEETFNKCYSLLLVKFKSRGNFSTTSISAALAQTSISNLSICPQSDIEESIKNSKLVEWCSILAPTGGSIERLVSRSVQSASGTPTEASWVWLKVTDGFSNTNALWYLAGVEETYTDSTISLPTKLPSSSPDGGGYYLKKNLAGQLWEFSLRLGLDTSSIRLTSEDETKILGIGAKSLESIFQGALILPTTITTLRIGDYAFNECGQFTGFLNSPSSNWEGQLIEVGEWAFHDCVNLRTKLTLSDQITEVRDSTFMRCENLEEIIFNGNLKNIGPHAFHLCRMLKNLPDLHNLETLGAYAFNGVGGALESPQQEILYIPAALTEIPEQVFDGCKLINEVQLGDTGENGFQLKAVKYRAFAYCTGLTKVTFPDTIETFGENVLAGCSQIMELKLPFIGAIREPESYTDLAELSYPRYPLGYLFFIHTSGSSYPGFTACSATYYTSYDGTKLVNETSTWYIPPSLRKVEVTDLGNYTKGAFQNCTPLQQVIIKNHAHRTMLPENAFRGCSNLAELSLAEDTAAMSYEKVGYSCFLNCANKCTEPQHWPNEETKKTFFTKLKSVGEHGFCGYKGFPSEVSLDNIEEIYPLAFADTPVQKLTLGPKLTKIKHKPHNVGTNASSGASDLDKNYRVYSTYTTASSATGDGILANCFKLESLTVPFIGAHPVYTIDTDYRGFSYGYFFNGTKSTGETYQTNVWLTDSKGKISKAKNASNNVGWVNIPRTLTHIQVTGKELPPYAFAGSTYSGDSYKSTLTHITIVRDCELLPERTCYYCRSLQEFECGGLVAQIKCIDDKAFEGCSSLEWFNRVENNSFLGHYLETLGADAFRNCTKLGTEDNLTAGNSITRIKAATAATLPHPRTETPFYGTAFFNGRRDDPEVYLDTYDGTGCYLLQISTSNKSINEDYDLKLREDTLLIADYAAANLKCDQIILDTDTDLIIGEGAFYNFKFSAETDNPDRVLTLNNNIKSIGNYAFMAFYLSSLDLDYSRINELVVNAQSIGKYAFDNQRCLKKLTIGEKVLELHEGAFADTWLLSQLNYNAIDATLIANSAYNKIFYRSGIGGEWLTDPKTRSSKDWYSVWVSTNGMSVVIGANVEKIPDYLFRSSETMFARLNPEESGKLTDDSEGWLKRQSPYIRYITFADGPEMPDLELGDFCFSNCPELEQCAIAGRVNRVGSYAFSGTGSLVKVLYDLDEWYAGSAYNYYTHHIYFTLPSRCRVIEHGAFNGFEKLPGIHVESTKAKTATGETGPAGQLTTYYVQGIMGGSPNWEFVDYWDQFTNFALVGAKCLKATGDLKYTSASGRLYFDVTIPTTTCIIADQVFYECGLYDITDTNSPTYCIATYSAPFCGRCRYLSLMAPLLPTVYTLSQILPYPPKNIKITGFSSWDTNGLQTLDSIWVVSESEKEKLYQGGVIVSNAIPLARRYKNGKFDINFAAEDVSILKASRIWAGALDPSTLGEATISLNKLTIPYTGKYQSIGNDQIVHLGYIFGEPREYDDTEAYPYHVTIDGKACRFNIPSSLIEVTILNGNKRTGADSAAGFRIPKGAFQGCEFLTSVEIKRYSDEYDYSGEVKKYRDIIEKEAFRNCLKLKDIVFSSDTTSIHENAFENCESLVTCKLPDSLWGLFDEAFKNCSSLRFLKLPKHLEKLGNNIIAGCTNINSVFYIPASLRYFKSTVLEENAENNTPYLGKESCILVWPATLASNSSLFDLFIDVCTKYRNKATKIVAPEAAIKKATSALEGVLDPLAIDWQTSWIDYTLDRDATFNYLIEKGISLPTVKNEST